MVLFPQETLTRPDNASQWWRRAAAEAGLTVTISTFEEFDPDASLPDFAVMRGYDEAISTALESKGVRVFSPYTTMVRSLDKWQTYQALENAGIPTPHTILPSDFTEAESILGRPFVTKQRNGSRGINVFLCDSLPSYARALDACGGNAVLQQYIKESHGRDVRVWTIGDECVAAVLRNSDGALVSNYSQGGHAKPYPMDAELKRLAIDASKAIGLDFAGVDVLFGRDGYTVCEINGNAGFRTLFRTSDTDILHIFFQYVDNELRRNS